MIRHPRPLVGPAAAGLLALTGAAAAALAPAAAPIPAAALAPAAAPAPGATPAPAPRAGDPPTLTLAAYQALSASQWRNYDRTQDISPRQLLILLEVAERTGASLGQALATGELESARTWNDFVRPTLRNGSLGAATGVWQFMPGTFHMIIRKYGAELLAVSAADPAVGRGRLDLGNGPFTDPQVRAIIQGTVQGKRGADDEELRLLRHNFTVLAFAKHYLSRDSGATTPEEDYLFHFLGTTQGRRVLALARGEARDTLCVKLPPPPAEPPSGLPDPAADLLTGPVLPAAPRVLERPPAGLTRAALLPPLLEPPARAPSNPPERRIQARAEPGSRDVRVASLRAQGAFEVIPPPVLAPASPSGTRPDALSGLLPNTPLAEPPPPPPPSSEWGLPAESPTVTGNLGMFYRDGKGQSQPYTWGEFMENLARRVRAKDQPAMVRGKYGVGFALKGGDLPERAFDPERPGDLVAFRSPPGDPLLVPEALILGPLDRDEMRRYKDRLTALVALGEDRPIPVPPEAVATLRGLEVPPAKVRGRAGTKVPVPAPQAPVPQIQDPQVQGALAAFRKRVGKDAPDDPAHRHLLAPAERIALEVYGQRLAHYGALQSGQQATLGSAPDLNRIRKLPAGQQRRAAPQIAAVQVALAARGLLTQPTQKVTWRDKKRRKHVEHRPAPFTGKPDKATIAALDGFQVRHGLRRTNGILDAVTLRLLGLPPLGAEILSPLAGPQCDFDGWAGSLPRSATPAAPPAPALPPRLTRAPGPYFNDIRAAAASPQPADP